MHSPSDLFENAKRRHHSRPVKIYRRLQGMPHPPRFLSIILKDTFADGICRARRHYEYVRFSVRHQPKDRLIAISHPRYSKLTLSCGRDGCQGKGHHHHRINGYAHGSSLPAMVTISLQIPWIPLAFQSCRFPALVHSGIIVHIHLQKIGNKTRRSSEADRQIYLRTGTVKLDSLQ